LDAIIVFNRLNLELWVEWRFYEAADFVKTRWKIISFIFDPFWPPFDNNSPLWLWC